MEFKLKDNLLTINGEAYKLVPVEEQQVIEEPAQEKARTGWERAKEGDEFYVLDYNTSEAITDSKNEFTDGLYSLGNYFNDKQLCNGVGRAVSLYLRILRWQAENDVPVDVYNPKVKKWYIRYSIMHKKFYTFDVSLALDIFCVYFSSKEKAEECIKVFESDLIWLQTQFYHRLDDIRIQARIQAKADKLLQTLVSNSD